jgi:hypothetical protein
VILCADAFRHCAPLFICALTIYFNNSIYEYIGVYILSILSIFNFIINFIIRYPSLAYRNTMDLQVKNIILNYIYNL